MMLEESPGSDRKNEKGNPFVQPEWVRKVFQKESSK